MGQTVDIAEGLFVDAPHPALIGGRHRETGGIVFPCPAGSADHEPVVLPRRGTLWSWTVQRFRPKTPPYAGPEEFTPFALGYVELPGAVIVEAPFTDVAFDELRIGMAMETVLVPLNGKVRTFAFAPVREG
ncbi:DNA-binding protein [Sphingobium amiense]|uniref:DNA-binding protein n=1 Tax=Sphingobium amiense TaxID=135719 RepID=A0A494WFV1_9SPHN|nr:OB-fold domain-containing protein [Sphingobium amiense]BBD99765.1 DNA-binding protein [Sphingobium amiense]